MLALLFALCLFKKTETPGWKRNHTYGKRNSKLKTLKTMKAMGVNALNKYSGSNVLRFLNGLGWMIP